MGLELHGVWVLSGQDETTMERDSMRNIWTERENIKARVAVYVIGFSRFPLGLLFSFFSFFFFFFSFFLLLIFFSFFFFFFWSKKKETFSTFYLSLQLTYSSILKTH